MSKHNCALCGNNIENVDYKDAETLRKFTSLQGKISSRKRTKLCAKHQRLVAQSIKRARAMAILPFFID